MLKRRSKHFALLLILAMLATMFVGLGTASAATTNTIIGAVPNISTTGVVTGAKLRIDESVLGNFAVGDVIVLTLPTGVAFNVAPTLTRLQSPGSTGAWAALTSFTFTATAAGYPQGTINITVTGACTNGAPTALDITMPLNVTSVGSGAINVNVAAPGTAITTGDYTIAAFVAGGATVSALSTPATGGTATYGTIRIIENAIGSISTGQTLTLKLPGGYTWGASTLTPSNNTTFAAVAGVGTQTITYSCTLTGTLHPGIFDITTPIVAASGAALGDVTVTVGGTSNISADVTVGSNANYGITVTNDAAKAVTAAIDNQKIAVVYVKEDIAGSLIPNRTITFTLPSNTEFTAAPTLTLVSGGGVGWVSILTVLSSTNTVATATLPATVSTSAAKFELKNVYIDVAANVKGDINMVVGGTATASGQGVVAIATPVITMSATSKDIIIGLQSQPAGDITIVEGVKGALLGGGKFITLTAPAGVTFTAVPTVAVTSGNMTIKSVSKAGGVVTITTDASSTVASTIVVSGILLTADRSVPEGPAKIAIAGTAVMQNTSVLSAANFATVTAAGVVVAANVVTPAPGGATVVSTFVVGASTYVLNGQTVDCFSTPYIKNARLFLSIRDTGAALGISQANILWDASKSTVTLMKGDKVVQVAIGSKVMLINGAAVTMDVAPEYNPAGNRAMLPAAWIANAFAGSAVYNSTDQSVVINS